METPASGTRTRPPDRKRSRCGGGDGDGGDGGGGGSTPAVVEGDTLCPAAPPPVRHTPSAKSPSGFRDSVIREMEVTPHPRGEASEDQEMADARDKGCGGEDGRRFLRGGTVGVAVTPLERNPQMPDPASMRKCLDEYMEVRFLGWVTCEAIFYFAATPTNRGPFPASHVRISHVPYLARRPECPKTKNK